MKDYGIQMYSVRDITKDNMEGALKALAEMGYKYVEFAGFFGIPAHLPIKEEAVKILKEQLLPLRDQLRVVERKPPDENDIVHQDEDRHQQKRQNQGRDHPAAQPGAFFIQIARQQIVRSGKAGDLQDHRQRRQSQNRRQHA